MSTSTNPPAGWYPDPTNRGGQRYWNGTAWTDQANNIAPPPFTAASSLDALPWWQTWWVVVPALIFLAPLGLIGLWKRQRTSTTAKWIISAATAVFVVIVLVTPNSKPTTPAAKVPTAPASTPAIQLVSVPVVVGQSSTRAEQALTAAGLQVGSVTRKQSSQRPGTIISEYPVAGAHTPPGSLIDLVVAAPRPRVPSVLGLSRNTAATRLRAAGLIPVVVLHTVTSGRNNKVLSQSPSGGTSAGSGEHVRIVVSNVVAPPPTYAPPPPPAQPSCTTTSSGSCIRGGEFCPQADYGMTGYDAYGNSYTCTGDQTHPHWE